MLTNTTNTYFEFQDAPELVVTIVFYEIKPFSCFNPLLISRLTFFTWQMNKKAGNGEKNGRKK